MEHIQRSGNARGREIRIGGAQHQISVELAGVDFHGQVVAGAKSIFLTQTKAQHHLFSRGKTSPQRDTARRLFSHRDHQIHLVQNARDLNGLQVHAGEETQAVDAVAGQANFVAVVPGRLELAELAADHFIPGAVVARHNDAANIGTARRLSHQHKLNAVVLTVYFGFDVDFGKSKAELAKIIGEGFGGFGHCFGVVGLANPDRDQGFEFIILAQVIALQLNARNHKALALGQVDRDAHVLLVGRHGHLGRINAKL